MGDPYHSRRRPHWEIIDRADPVIWGRQDGPLSAAELADFERDGFLVLPELFTAAEVERLLADARRLAAGLDSAAEHVVTEPDSDVIRSVFRVHRDGPAFAALATDERLRGAARQIVGGEVYIHQSRVNFKPGFAGRKFDWHSDFETWHVEDGMPRMRAVSASVLLTENTPVNGPLMLVPGSHRAYVRCVGGTPEDHYKRSLKAQAVGVPTREALTALTRDRGIAQALGPPGTVILFDCNTMHGSTENLSPDPRHNVFLVFNSVENRLVEPFGRRAPRPDFLAERDPTAALRS